MKNYFIVRRDEITLLNNILFANNLFNEPKRKELQAKRIEQILSALKQATE